MNMSKQRPRLLSAVCGLLFCTPLLAVPPSAASAIETYSSDGVDGCQTYYPAGENIILATGAQDGDCWDASMISKPNRTFLGWSETRLDDVMTAADYERVKSEIVTSTTMPEGGRDVYAVWAAMPVLTYDVNKPSDGVAAPEPPASVTVEFNTPAVDASGWKTGDTGLIPGYSFDGWYPTDSGGYPYDFSQPLLENTTVYAHWTASEYTVKYMKNAQDATGSMSDQRFTFDQAQNLTRNAFERRGYSFTGWNTKPDGTGDKYTDGQSVKNLTDKDGGTVTLYAQWKINRVNIAYDANGGEGSHAKTAGDALSDITIPNDVDEAFSRSGWMLIGWNTKPDGTGDRYTEGDRIHMSVSDVTLYAQWARLNAVLPVAGTPYGLYVNWPVAGPMLAMAVCLGGFGVWRLLNARNSTASGRVRRHTGPRHGRG